MFTGFSEETIEFFLDLRFHNNTTFFHEQHDRYVECVQKPFYNLIEDLSDDMRMIDPLMEIRPSKCLSHIHRDTRFSKDKSPYRDHLWFLFRRAGEPRDKSLNYFFEFGPGRIGWGMGFWGENRAAMDIFRRKIIAEPETVRTIISKCQLDRHCFVIDGSMHKRMRVPEEVPHDLICWYLAKEIWVLKEKPSFTTAFQTGLADELRSDYVALAPLYRLLRGCYDENI